MTTQTEIRSATEETAKQLRKAGINVQPYARSPLSNSEMFTISLDPQNVLRMWNGTAEVTVVASTDKKLKQAVLQVYEKGRTVKTTWNISGDVWERATNFTRLQQVMTDYRIQTHLGVALPPGAEYSVEEYHRVEKPEQPSEANNYQPPADRYGTAVLVGKVKATRQNFLVGRDEKSQFISALPRKATSVKDAHDALRPADVPKSALRHGEWFFVPATKPEKDRIQRAINDRGSAGLYADTDYSGHYRTGHGTIRRHSVGELEPGSSHHAPALITVGSRRYATGLVYDTRPSRHGQLMLADWHRVIRNREVVNPTSTAERGASTARWD